MGKRDWGWFRPRRTRTGQRPPEAGRAAPTDHERTGLRETRDLRARSSRLSGPQITQGHNKNCPTKNT